MSKRLSSDTIRQRMIEWRNYRCLYPELQRKYDERGEEIRALKQTVVEQQAVIEKLLLRVEGLERMVFGKKRQADEAPPSTPPPVPPQKKQRTSGSYRRPVPLPAAVTRSEEHPLDCCPDCGTTLRRKKIVLHIIEDMVLPTEDGNPFKTVEEHRIETGYCPACRKRVAALPLPKQTCTLGPNVRRYVPYAVTVLGRTWEKVRTFLKDVCDLEVSDGEIARILHSEKQRLLPAYHALAVRVRDAPAAHYDETGYPVQAEGQGQFGWVKTAADYSDTLFLLGRTRGKGNAEELRGEQSTRLPSPTTTGHTGHSSASITPSAGRIPRGSSVTSPVPRSSLPRNRRTAQQPMLSSALSTQMSKQHWHSRSLPKKERKEQRMYAPVFARLPLRTRSIP